MVLGGPTFEYRLTAAGREYLTDLSGPDRDDGRMTTQFTRRAIEIYSRLNNWQITSSANLLTWFEGLTERLTHINEYDRTPRTGHGTRARYRHNFQNMLAQRMNLDRTNMTESPRSYACLRDAQGGGYVVDPAHRGIVLQRTVDYVEHIGMSELAELVEETENNPELEEEHVALLDGIEATDTTRTTTVRVEQPRLRIALAQRLGWEGTATCCICHNEVPLSGAYIWCAHIKPRSVADENERRDVNIVAGMCKFGCDALYERGDIVVDENGVVRENLRASNDWPSLRDEMAELDGNEVLNYSSLNAEYFEWHREFHGFNVHE